jgi:hypothetical protein
VLGFGGCSLLTFFIPAGLLYLMDKSGELMGTTTEILSDTPFDSFLIPGLFLVIVNGIGQAAGAYVSFKLKPFAGISGLTLGIVLIIWIIMQVYWIGFTHFLQPFFFVVGVIEASIGYYIFKRGALTYG